MQIYVMDRDYEVMKKLEVWINGNAKFEAKCFTGLQALTEAVKREPPGAVILDFDGQNSYSAVRTIQRESPQTQIVMLSENKNKAVELFELGLSGFLMKPPDEEKVSELLFRLQHPILAKLKTNKEGT